MSGGEVHTIDIVKLGMPMKIDADKYTADNQLKFKLRSTNMIKYNPNLFRNRQRNGDFYQMIGGDKGVIATLGFGAGGMIYRMKSNQIHGIKRMSGGWGRNITFAATAGMGFVFNIMFLANQQQFMNDYNSLFLMKRFKGSSNLTRSNIWLQRFKENNDECYYFTSSYMNTYHM